MKSILDAVLPHLDKIIVGAGAGAVAFLVKKFLGPKLLAKFITSKARAALLEDAAEFAAKHLAGIVQATPNKYDDLGLELIKAIEAWAEAKRVELSLIEKNDVALKARELLVKNTAIAAGLSGLRVVPVQKDSK